MEKLPSITGFVYFGSVFQVFLQFYTVNLIYANETKNDAKGNLSRPVHYEKKKRPFFFKFVFRN